MLSIDDVIRELWAAAEGCEAVGYDIAQVRKDAAVEAARLLEELKETRGPEPRTPEDLRLALACWADGRMSTRCGECAFSDRMEEAPNGYSCNLTRLMRTVREEAFPPITREDAIAFLQEDGWLPLHDRELTEPCPARLMSAEELLSLPDGTVVWEEFRHEDGYRQLYPIMACGDGTLVRNDCMTDVALDVKDGRFRWWSSRPDDEQRRTAKWK